jgi:hypothetical protein
VIPAGVLDHLQHNWPLTLAVAMMLLYLPVVLASGSFYTNQGTIRRVLEPARYWRWVLGLCLLLLVSGAVLLGSYALSGR